MAATASSSRAPATTGRWNRLPAEARTHLPLYGSTDASANTTACAPAASAVRSTVPALPGSRTLASSATRAGALGHRGERDVHEPADRQQALRGHRLGQVPHHFTADHVHGDARTAQRRDEVGVPAPGVRGHEQVGDLGPAAKRLRHGLRALGEEGPLTLAESTLGQAPRGLEPR